MSDIPARPTRRRIPDGEQGAVIVEFAAVFVVFAILLAGLISYGMIFAVQQSLEHAASESARAAVGVADEGDAEGRVRDTLNEQLGWLASGDTPLDHPDVEAVVCPMDGATACSGVADGDLYVQVTYSGGLLSLMPFQIATPSQLRASAVLEHDLEGDA